METTLFGLPLTTVLIFTAVPAVLIVLLVWWGLTYRPSDENGPADEGRKR